MKQYKSTTGIVLVALISFAALSGCTTETSPSRTQNQAPAQPRRSAVSIETLSVGELYAAFRANELAFDQKYVGKTVTISGQVDDVQDGLFDQGYIVTFIGEPYGHCELASDQLDAAAKLSAGQTVKMQGVVEKGIVGFSLNDCIIK